MKLTDEQREAVPGLPVPVRTLYGPNRTIDGHYFSADQMRAMRETAFLAGCAWQRERDAKILDELDKGFGGIPIYEIAERIRAQGDDRG